VLHELHFLGILNLSLYCKFTVMLSQCLYYLLTVVFTALHAMQTRSSDEKAVCPSVKCVDCDKTEEISVQIFIPYEILFSLVF